MRQATRLSFSLFEKSAFFKKFIHHRKYSIEKLNVSSVAAEKTTMLKDGPGLKEFLVAGKNFPAPQRDAITSVVPYLNPLDYFGNGRKVFFEVYGCQMNVSDTEVVWAILKKSGYTKVDEIKEADVVLVITCAIREGAETKVILQKIFILIPNK